MAAALAEDSIACIFYEGVLCSTTLPLNPVFTDSALETVLW